jgi:hypothetical protein
MPQNQGTLHTQGGTQAKEQHPMNKSCVRKNKRKTKALACGSHHANGCSMLQAQTVQDNMPHKATYVLSGCEQQCLYKLAHC